MGLFILIKFFNWETILNRSDSIFISIVIPIYNEEESLPHLMEELDEVISGVSYGIEVILINDVSTDGSPRLIEEFEKKYYYVKSIYLYKKGDKQDVIKLPFNKQRVSI